MWGAGSSFGMRWLPCKVGALQKKEEHIADRCEMLVRGFARVGIIALFDEAVGFQRDRANGSLARILEKHLRQRNCDPPPLKWSDLRYVFDNPLVIECMKSTSP
jgi:hypothetical protein